MFALSIHPAEASIHQWSTIGSNFDHRRDWWDRIYNPKGQLVGHFFQATGESERSHASCDDTPNDDMHNLEGHGMKLSDSIFELPFEVA